MDFPSASLPALAATSSASLVRRRNSFLVRMLMISSVFTKINELNESTWPIGTPGRIGLILARSISVYMALSAILPTLVQNKT